MDTNSLKNSNREPPPIGEHKIGSQASSFGHRSQRCCTLCTWLVSVFFRTPFGCIEALKDSEPTESAAVELVDVHPMVEFSLSGVELIHCWTGLCQRRQWPEPYYEVTPSRHGYTCIVRVNNREYQTPRYHPSEVTAKEAAATIAFNICRSFSVNDGMYPSGFAHDNVVQGRAVPVGAGRANRKSQTTIRGPDYRGRAESISSGSRSGGSSPDISDDSSTSPYNRHTSRANTLYASGRHIAPHQRHYGLSGR